MDVDMPTLKPTKTFKNLKTQETKKQKPKITRKPTIDFQNTQACSIPGSSQNTITFAFSILRYRYCVPLHVNRIQEKSVSSRNGIDYRLYKTGTKKPEGATLIGLLAFTSAT